MILTVLAAVGFERKDAHLKEVAARILEEGGIAQLVHDVFVDLPRIVRRKQLGLGHLSSDLHAELVDMRAFRDREKVSAFELSIVGVVNLLIVRSDRDLAVDPDVDVVTRHFERRKCVMAGRHAHRLLDDDKTIVVHLREETAGTSSDKQKKAGVYEALVGRAEQMLPNIFRESREVRRPPASGMQRGERLAHREGGAVEVLAIWTLTNRSTATPDGALRQAERAANAAKLRVFRSAIEVRASRC